MTKYVMAVIGPRERTEFGSYGSPGEMREAMEATGRFNDRLRDAGMLVFVDALAPADTARVVDGRGPVPSVSGGAFGDAAECFNGMWIVDVADDDAAVQVAAEASAACRGRVEVRALAGG